MRTVAASPRAAGTRRPAPSSPVRGGCGPRSRPDSCVEAALLRQLRDAELEQRLGHEQAFLDRLEHEVVRTFAQQVALVLAILVARHHEHRQLALAVTEVVADP